MTSPNIGSFNIPMDVVDYEQVPVVPNMEDEEFEQMAILMVGYLVMMIVFVLPFVLHIAVGCLGYIHEYFRCLREKYNNFSQRSRRREFIGFQFTHYCLLYDMILLDTLLGGSVILGDERAMIYIPGYFTVAYCIISFIPTLAVKIRRLHDTGRSGWWLVLDFVPLASIIPQCIMWFADSELGTNAYGANPKGHLRPEELLSYIRETEADILEEGLVTYKRVNPTTFKTVIEHASMQPANAGYTRLHDGEFDDLPL